MAKLDALVPSWGSYDQQPLDRIIRAGTTLFHATPSFTVKPLDPSEMFGLSYYSIDPRHPIHVLVEHIGEEVAPEPSLDGPGTHHPMLFEFIVIRDIPGRFQREGDDPTVEFLLRFRARRSDYLRHVRTYHMDADYFLYMHKMGPKLVGLDFTGPDIDERPYYRTYLPMYAPGPTPTTWMTDLGMCEDIMCQPNVIHAANTDDARVPTLDPSLQPHLQRCRTTVKNVLKESVLTSYLLLRQLQERFGATRPRASSIAALLAAVAHIATTTHHMLGQQTQIYVFSSTKHTHVFTEGVFFTKPDTPPVTQMPEVRMIAHVRLLGDINDTWFRHGRVQSHKTSVRPVGASILGIALAVEDEKDEKLEYLAIEFCIRVMFYVRYHRRAIYDLGERLLGHPYTMCIPTYVRHYQGFSRLREACAEHKVELVWNTDTIAAPADERELKRTRFEQRARNSLC